jgi:hypothetical protein
MAKNVHNGSCLCGAVTFEAAGDPVLVAQCHCPDCQKASGAPHVAFAAFPEAAVTIAGALKGFKKPADAGVLSDRRFCPECGSWIAGRPGSAPGVIALTLATMDDASDMPIQMRFFDRRRRAWDPVDTAMLALPAMPPAQA